MEVNERFFPFVVGIGVEILISRKDFSTVDAVDEGEEVLEMGGNRLKIDVGVLGFGIWLVWSLSWMIVGEDTLRFSCSKIACSLLATSSSACPCDSSCCSSS